MEKLLDVVYKTQTIEGAAAKPKRTTKADFLNPFFIFLFISVAKMYLILPIIV